MPWWPETDEEAIVVATRLARMARQFVRIVCDFPNPYGATSGKVTLTETEQQEREADGRSDVSSG